MSEETSRRNKGRESKKKNFIGNRRFTCNAVLLSTRNGWKEGDDRREREVRDNRRFLRFLDKHRHTAHYYTVVERRKQLFSPPPSELCAQVTRAAETRGN